MDLGFLEDFRPGVLNKEQLLELSNQAVIQGSLMSNSPESAFDLCLGNEYWLMKGCIKGVGSEHYYRILQAGSKFVEEHKADLPDATTITLLKGKTYVFKLKESLNYGGVSGKFYGFATGRSTIGRLDVLVRLIEDNSPYYDRVSEKEVGPLYLEVTPITFNIIVKPGSRLSQLRIFYGEQGWSEIKTELLQGGYFGDILIDDNGQAITELDKLTLNLLPDTHGDDKIVAFMARENAEAIDLTKDNSQQENRINPKEYWESIPPSNDNIIKIEKGKFYILRSIERIRLPDDLSIYCEAVSEEYGEIRIHYAGFVHPCFGLYRPDNLKKGAPLIFEVRGHTVETFLRHGETLATLKFYKMSKPSKYNADAKKNEIELGYSSQELKLSNYFKDWV